MASSKVGDSGRGWHRHRVVVETEYADKKRAKMRSLRKYEVNLLFRLKGRLEVRPESLRVQDSQGQSFELPRNC